MSRIRTITQTGTKTDSVTANAYDAIIKTVPLTDSADTSFSFTVNNSYVQDVSTILVTPIYPLLNTFSTRAVTLTGTTGTANIAVNGTNYLATFTSSLTTSATNFVTSHGATLLALGITVTANSGVLTFSALTASFPTLTITNASGDLAGTIAAISATATTGNVHVNLVSSSRGQFVVRVTNIGTAALNCFAQFAFKLTHN
jgi:hypothetical protein